MQPKLLENSVMFNLCSYAEQQSFPQPAEKIFYHVLYKLKSKRVTLQIYLIGCSRAIILPHLLPTCLRRKSVAKCISEIFLEFARQCIKLQCSFYFWNRIF